MANVVAPVLRLFETRPEREWLSGDGVTLTGRTARREIAGRQVTFGQSGIGAGSRVLVQASRGLEFWLDVCALWGLGSVPIPLDQSIGESQLPHVLYISEPRFYLGPVPPEHSPLAKLCRVNFVDRAGESEALEPVDLDGSAPALVLFTSGSTGQPKAVLLSHRALIANVEGTCEVFRLQSRRRLLAAVPFRSVSALSHFLATLYACVEYEGTERRFLMGDFVDYLRASGVDAFGGSPLQALWIVEAAEQMRDQIRWIMSSGDHLPTTTISQILERMPATHIVTAYGLTELGGRFCILDPDDVSRRAGSVGTPIPGLAIAILDENGDEVPAGKVGEIVGSGAAVFDEYLRNHEATAACKTSRGLHTGDLGYIDEEGYVHLVGRNDDIFKSGGVKVSTTPIAAQLLQLGIFDDVAVIPRDHGEWGQVPHAFVKLKPNAEFDRGEVMRALRHELPASHLPRSFSLVEEIPRTGTGKVRRAELKKLL